MGTVLPFPGPQTTGQTGFERSELNRIVDGQRVVNLGDRVARELHVDDGADDARDPADAARLSDDLATSLQCGRPDLGGRPL